mmetsp:Transcript_18788/g.21234  ORF Transcript_18788/g.21234 Transcript_18788/m.21234 type:complete len:695 (+) Transcript_18788:225-2309(+)|eukprot:CAMPEP_0114997968 /NCGR_PEP_ID=MMETSP0216-20121206/15217_1 /TAXON_ID=223996 /ORGANISM="Protocruzia adherens, Strain Boccale" /LENGTH=694 /DNA_ID=CAMNT_0002362455 /DNA_START=146 /DNA_END=2230 /DNA_ORIENTATION=-
MKLYIFSILFTLFLLQTLSLSLEGQNHSYVDVMTSGLVDRFLSSDHAVEITGGRSGPGDSGSGDSGGNEGGRNGGQTGGGSGSSGGNEGGRNGGQGDGWSEPTTQGPSGEPSKSKPGNTTGKWRGSDAPSVRTTRRCNRDYRPVAGRPLTAFSCDTEENPLIPEPQCEEFSKSSSWVISDVDSYFIDTPHDYCNSMSISHHYEFSNDSVEAILVEFDDETAVEKAYDSLRLKVGQGTDIKNFTCNKFEDFIIEAREFDVTFSTDGSQGNWGYGLKVTPITDLASFDTSKYANANYGNECFQITTEKDGNQIKETFDLQTCSEKALAWIEDMSPAINLTQVDALRSKVSFKVDFPNSCVESVSQFALLNSVPGYEEFLNYDVSLGDGSVELSVNIHESNTNTGGPCHRALFKDRLFLSCPMRFRGVVAKSTLRGEWKRRLSLVYSHSPSGEFRLKDKKFVTDDERAMTVLPRSSLKTKREVGEVDETSENGRFTVNTEVIFIVPFPESSKYFKASLDFLTIGDYKDDPPKIFYLTSEVNTKTTSGGFEIEVPLIFATSDGKIEAAGSWIPYQPDQNSADGEGDLNSRLLEAQPESFAYSAVIVIDEANLTEDKHNDELSGLAIGLIIGAVVIFVVALAGSLLCYLKRNKKSATPVPREDPEGDSTTRSGSISNTPFSFVEVHKVAVTKNKVGSCA